MLFMNAVAGWHCLVIPHSLDTRDYVLSNRINDKITSVFIYSPTENMLSDSGSHSCLYSSQCVTLITQAKDLFFIIRSEIQAMLIILLTMKGYCED